LLEGDNTIAKTETKRSIVQKEALDITVEIRGGVGVVTKKKISLAKESRANYVQVGKNWKKQINQKREGSNKGRRGSYLRPYLSIAQLSTTV